MRKIIAVLTLLITLLGTFCACGKSTGSMARNNGKVKIVTTVFPAYDFAKQVAKTNADVTMLLPFGAETHSYEPTLSDIKKINECDLFIYVGGNTDGWAEDIIEKYQNEERAVISLTEVCGVTVHTHDENEENHEHGTEPDEHVWTSIKNSEKIVQKICDVLAEKFPESAEVYKADTQDYIVQLGMLDKEYENAVKNAKKETVVFADRFPFYHLFKDYGIKHISALKGCSSDAEPTITDLSKVIKTVKNEKMKNVFYVEFSNMSVCDKVVSETGAKKALLHSCHSVTEEEYKNGETYLSLMRKNLENLKEALG